MLLFRWKWRQRGHTSGPFTDEPLLKPVLQHQLGGIDSSFVLTAWSTVLSALHSIFLRPSAHLNSPHSKSDNFKLIQDRRSPIHQQNSPSLGSHPHQRPRPRPHRRRRAHRLRSSRPREGTRGMRAHCRFDPIKENGGKGLVVGGCAGDG